MTKPYTAPTLTDYGTIKDIQPEQPADSTSDPKYALLTEVYLMLFGNYYQVRSSPQEPYGPPIAGVSPEWFAMKGKMR